MFKATVAIERSYEVSDGDLTKYIGTLRSFLYSHNHACPFTDH